MNAPAPSDPGRLPPGDRLSPGDRLPPGWRPERADRGRDVDILARTVYGEARGEPARGKEAVAAVVMNRVRRARNRGGYWWGDTVARVCRKPRQFSCWNEADPNRAKILAVEAGHRVFDSCLRIARRAIAGTLKDPTNGATHYHADGVCPPWSAGRAPSAEIGRHRFYNNVE